MGRFQGDFEQGNAGIAYLGSRNDVWHRLGHEMEDGMSLEDWAKASGNDFEALSVQATYQYDGRERLADDLRFIVRRDNGRLLGRSSVTDTYQPHQPIELFHFFKQYISVDDRFKMDVAGNYKGGAIIWASAIWREPLSIAGDNHVARLLMTTSFDGSAATRNQMCVTRPVCDNTLAMTHTEHKGALVTTKHNTKFNAERVGRELAGLAQSVLQYKKIGDAMASVHMSADDVKAFFRDVLDIPREAKQDDISTRKLNQYRALSTAFSTTRRERNAKQGDAIDVWTALQAVTRYVDHDRISINGDNGEKQFLSATFGSGDVMKGTAMGLLMPRVRDLIAA